MFALSVLIRSASTRPLPVSMRSAGVHVEVAHDVADGDVAASGVDAQIAGDRFSLGTPRTDSKVEIALDIRGLQYADSVPHEQIGAIRHLDHHIGPDLDPRAAAADVDAAAAEQARQPAHVTLVCVERGVGSAAQPRVDEAAFVRKNDGQAIAGCVDLDQPLVGVVALDGDIDFEGRPSVALDPNLADQVVDLEFTGREAAMFLDDTGRGRQGEQDGDGQDGETRAGDSMMHGEFSDDRISDRVPVPGGPQQAVIFRRTL